MVGPDKTGVRWKGEKKKREIDQKEQRWNAFTVISPRIPGTGQPE